MDDKDEQIKSLGAVIKKWACPALDDLGSLMLAGRLIGEGYIRPVEPPPVLTEKQKQAETWLELDNETVGQVVKQFANRIKVVSEEDGKLAMFSAALMLCSMAAQANADKLTETIEGLTIHGNPFGTWKVTVAKVAQRDADWKAVGGR